MVADPNPGPSWQTKNLPDYLRATQNEKKAADARAAFNGGGSSCFPGDVFLRTPSGHSDFSKIQRGDFVLSWNASQGCLIARRVRHKNTYRSATIWQLCVAGLDKPLRVTGSHTLMTVQGWTKVSRLTSESRLILQDGLDAAVISISKTGEQVPVFNIRTEGEHNFIAGGVVAHNFTNFRKTRSFMHSIIEHWYATGRKRVPLSDTELA